MKRFSDKMLDLLLLKFIIAVLVVLALSIISEKINPKMAGFISGLPTGTAITLFFFGLELGPEFASESATFNLSGMVALQFFIYVYYKTSEVFEKYTIIISSLFSIAAYILVISLLYIANVGLIGSVLLSIISIPAFIHLFRKIEDTKIKRKIELDSKTLVFRAIIASTIILFVINLAGIVGPKWAGLFSAFPTTLFPLILITHYTYEKKYVHTIIKNVPYGILSVVMYSIGVFYLYPLIGVYAGTFVSYLLVILYIFSYFSCLAKPSR